MDYQDVVYIDPRNADHRAAVNDHRTGVMTVVRQPRPVTQAIAPAAVAPFNTMAPQYQYQQPYPYSQFPPSSGLLGYPLNPAYAMPPPSNLSTILGGFGDLGSLANIAAQVLASLLPLPSSPTPQDNSEDAATNASVNSSNLIRYQNALALFARRDQQILTVGSVLKELLKRPGYGG